MGLCGSKDKTKEKKGEEGSKGGAAATQNNANAAGSTASSPVEAQRPPESARSVDAPSGRAKNPNDANVTNQDRASSKAAPGNAPRRGADASTAASQRNDVDEDGNPVVLPKGDWVKTEGTPYYYSATENLYFHPPSGQFYDPSNEMWYDPEKNEWYHDDDEDEDAAGPGM